MDLSDPEVWKNGFAIALSAPHIVLPGIGAVAFAVWWFRGIVEKGAKKNLKERVGVLEERLRLAQDKEGAIREKLGRAEAQVFEVQRSISDKSSAQLNKTAHAAIETISEIVNVSRELSKLLIIPGNHDNPQA